MTPQNALVAVAFTLLLYAALAGLYVTGAWALCRKLGVRFLPLLWLSASLLATLVVWYRSANPPFWIAVGLGTMFPSGFGLASLSVRRRMIKDASAGLTFGMLARGLGAFICGVALALAPFLIGDLRRLLEQ
jgi:hypothetical protein